MKLIYLSPVRWESFSQRPHELVTYFHARTGGKVLWMDPYPTRLPSLGDAFFNGQKMRQESGSRPDWLEIVKPRALPIEPLPFSGAVNSILWAEMLSSIDDFADDSTLLGIGKPSILACRLLSQRRFNWTFYDAMDDFPAFYRGLSRLSMARRVKAAVNGVSTILTSSSILRERLGREVKDVRLVLNACAAQRLPEIPLARARDSYERIVIGYVGTIARWFDWELLSRLARANAQARFRLIGPVHVRIPKTLPENVSIEPMLPHEDALRVMLQFDIGLIPFKLTSLTSSVDPIKYYEYRALGLPVISSAFGEMACRGVDDGVYLIGNGSDMKEVVRQALTYETSPDAIDKFRKDNSWEARFDQARLVSGGMI